MVLSDDFRGYSKKMVKFWRDLAKNNDKAWFEKNRAIYDNEVLAPNREFVVAMGSLLKGMAPQIKADPRVNKSLFRIHRDTRFSKDKTPYKTHMGLWWWEGPGKRMACSGFYFQLAPPKVMLGVGMYCLPKEMLPTFRDAVASDKYGPAMVRAIAKVEKAGYAVGGAKYKRVPRGYDKDHPRAELLKYDSLWASLECKIPPEFYTSELPDWCLPHYQAMLPVHQWLLAMTRRTA
ncbi:MAG: DUF2461 domain-containing protein [Desulfarculaceae bacterium]|nr:DUF2461 domain-containing protein [Desulfarculaceae bacterium]MCF8071289.1 DUF2461 domain-containing protein [Desulfarculaceae bacterium]MCF8101614.1 DUF2461 domain-containing protein [Desulfarculaceae bacterium]MCF8117446.1 DUF2461 domain-containing protein [Desulfarculaceae bacterium]